MNKLEKVREELQSHQARSALTSLEMDLEDLKDMNKGLQKQLKEALEARDWWREHYTLGMTTEEAMAAEGVINAAKVVRYGYYPRPELSDRTLGTVLSISIEELDRAIANFDKIIQKETHE